MSLHFRRSSSNILKSSQNFLHRFLNFLKNSTTSWKVPRTVPENLPELTGKLYKLPGKIRASVLNCLESVIHEYLEKTLNFPEWPLHFLESAVDLLEISRNFLESSPNFSEVSRTSMRARERSRMFPASGSIEVPLTSRQAGRYEKLCELLEKFSLRSSLNYLESSLNLLLAGKFHDLAGKFLELVG